MNKPRWRGPGRAATLAGIMERSSLNLAVAADGARIAYALRAAPARAPRFAFLHTLGMDHTLWDAVSERLDADAALLRLDMRGHGRSDRPAGAMGASVFAHDLLDVLDHVGWPDAIVVGSSLGGSVALQFAAEHPGRASALGLVDTTAWYGPDGPRQWNARARRAREEGLRAMVEFQETRWFSDAFRQARPDLVQRCVETFLRNDVQAFAAISEMLGRYDSRHLLSRIDIPVEIVVGEEDYATPVAMAQAMQRALRDARLTVVPAARHLPQIERPDAVAAMLRRLAARTVR